MREPTPTRFQRSTARRLATLPSMKSCGTVAKALLIWGISSAFIFAQNIALPPYVTDAPDSVTVNVGQAASFSVVAVGQPPDLRYQWQIKRVGSSAFLTLANSAPYSGVTSATLTVANTTAAMSGDLFQCVISNGAPPDATTAPVSLTVRAPPTITTQPSNQTANPNGSATFSVTATGSGTLSYRWSKDGADIAGATSATLALTNIQAGNAGAYSVAVTNEAGTATSRAATLAVTAGAPTIITQPVGQTVTQGANVTLSVVAASTATLSYQWRKDGALLAGATATALSLPNIQAASAGAYSVIITNSPGSVTSNSAVLVVNVPPTIATQPASQSVAPGASVSFTISAAGTAPLTYQWRKDGANLAGATAVTYSLAGVQTASAGNYSVVVTNLAGSATSANANLTVTIPAGPPIITIQPEHQAVAPGGSVTLSVAASGTGTLSYQWTKNGLNIPGATSSAYSITNAQLAHSGRYHVTVANPSGATTSAPAFLNLSGILWGFGDNTFGQLGEGRPLYREKPYPLMKGVKAVATGYSHTLILKTDGTLLGFGLNQDGQLGDGTKVNRMNPVTVASGVKAIATGNNFSHFIKNDGTLWAMGENYFGQHGDGTKGNIRYTPVQTATGVAAVATGYYHTLMLKTDGSVWSTGSNTYGQLGDGTTSDRSTWAQIATGAKGIATGHYHSLFIKANDSLWATGLNSFAMLGDGTSVNKNSPVQVLTGVSSASGGWYHNHFIKLDGTLWAIGFNNRGQLGDATNTTRSVAVQVAKSVTMIANGAGHSLYTDTGGTLWAMGANDEGELGDNSTSDRSLAVPIARNVNYVSSGYNHTGYVTTDGTLWMMGKNYVGQSGDGRVNTSLTTPVKIAEDVAMLGNSNGGGVFRYLKSDGGVWSMGRNLNSEVGDGSSQWGRSRPVEVARGAIYVGTGWYHAFLSRSDRSLWANGLNNAGQTSGTAWSNVPAQIATGISIANGGQTHSALLRDDGTLWMTGSNGFGELGDGTTTNKSNPVQIATGVAYAIAGNGSSYYIKHDGSLWATGDNYAGKLGDGGSIQRSSPVQVATGVSAVSPGGGSNYFIKTDGVLWAVGANSLGQLGDGSSTMRLTPVRIAENVVAVAAGWEHATYLTSDGALWYMGSDYTRQVAGGTAKPVKIANSVLQVATAGAATYFVQATGVGTQPRIASLATSNTTPTVGDAISLIATVSGSEPVDFQWYKKGIPIPGARSAVLNIPVLQAEDEGAYWAVVSNAAGTARATTNLALRNAQPARLGNLSILAPLTGNEVMTLGTVVGGPSTTGTKPLLLRAVGPALSQFGLAGVMADPKLVIYSGQTVSGSNDNWGGATSLSSVFGALGAFAYSSASSLDAAVYNPTMASGAHTVQVSGTGSGLVLAELYDATASNNFTNSTPRLINVSVLKQISASSILTTGFVVAGSNSKTVLIRAVGPGLAVFGVTGTMADPKLDLYAGQALINTNDNWGGTTSLASAFSAVGAFTLPTTSKDAALLVTLPPGNYTAQASGVAGSGGSTLVEVYEVP